MSIEKNIEHILRSIDPDAERLSKTPERVARSYKELFSGYNMDPKEFEAAIFDCDMTDLVLLKNIPFESHCEHHMAPIIGTVSIGYLPQGRIIGISKLARIVDCFAHRLQLQERLTMEIADAVDSLLNPLGVAVLIEGEHFCVCYRGVKKPGTRLVTRCFRGLAKDDLALRLEFHLSCS